MKVKHRSEHAEALFGSGASYLIRLFSRHNEVSGGGYTLAPTAGPRKGSDPTATTGGFLED